MLDVFCLESKYALTSPSDDAAITAPANDRSITGIQIIGQSPTPRNRNDRMNDSDPPLLFGMAVALNACNTPDMQPIAPPARNHRIPKEIGPGANEIRLENKTRKNAA